MGKLIINPSIGVNVIYSTNYNYKELLNNGVATYGDIIIESKTGEHGVLHINDTDFYFAGAAQYNSASDDNSLIWEHDDIYAKNGKLNDINIALTKSIYDISTNISKLSFDTSLYNFSLDTNIKNKENTKMSDIKTYSDALDILLNNLYYKKPDELNIDFTCNPTTFKLGDTTPVTFSWNIKNYTDKISSIIYNNTNYYDISKNIIETPSNTNISRTLQVTSNYIDSYNNSPATYNKTITCTMVIEDFYLPYINEYTEVASIPSSFCESFKENAAVLTNNNINIAADNYLYIILYQPNITNISISKVTNNTSSILSDIYFKNIGDIKLKKYDTSILYTIYKSNKSLSAGTYNIKKEKNSEGSSTDTDLYWDEI